MTTPNKEADETDRPAQWALRPAKTMKPPGALILTYRALVVPRRLWGATWRYCWPSSAPGLGAPLRASITLEPARFLGALFWWRRRRRRRFSARDEYQHLSPLDLMLRDSSAVTGRFRFRSCLSVGASHSSALLLPRSLSVQLSLLSGQVASPLAAWMTGWLSLALATRATFAAAPHSLQMAGALPVARARHSG